MFTALGRTIARHPLLVLAVWLVVLGIGAVTTAGVVGSGLFSRLTSSAVSVPGEASDGAAQLDQAQPSGAASTLLVSNVDLATPALAATLNEESTRLQRLDGVAMVGQPFAGQGLADPRNQAFVSEDKRSLVMTVVSKPNLPAAVQNRLGAQIDRELTAVGHRITTQVPGSSTDVVSVPKIHDAITHQIESDLRTGEVIALPISLALMVLVFGGLLAAGLPIVGALASIVGALTALLGMSYLTDLDATVVNVVTVLGLGLCIDYGLLMVSRFREELRHLVGDAAQASREHVEQATIRTCEIAGRTVVFSALTVAISLSSLMVFKAPILRAIGAAGLSVVTIAMLVAVTLVLALIRLAGTRLIRPGFATRVPGLRRFARTFGDVAPADGVFSRLGRWVQAHPWPVTIGVGLILVTAALPTLSMHVRASSIKLLPATNQYRIAFERVSSQFAATADAPVVVVVAGHDADVRAKTQTWRERIGAIDGVRTVEPPAAIGDVTVVRVHLADPDGGSPAAARIAQKVRDARTVSPSWVTGEAAGLLDFDASVRSRAPLVALIICLASALLLFLMTGSVLVPVKALVMNVLSLGATLGLLVLGFQDGYLNGLLDFEALGGLESVIAPLTLAFGFGLAMDYEVFLLARIKEFYDGGMPSDEAVVAGLQRSGRIISSAALIVVIVFLGFATGKLFLIKQMGVALAIAVALDSTLVRMLLVPATMTLLGRANWWAPAPLRAFHDRFGVKH